MRFLTINTTCKKLLKSDHLKDIIKKNKEERYSRVPRLSDTRFSKGNGDMQAAKRN